MIAALGFVFILMGAILILTTYTGSTGQVLGAIFGAGTGTPAPAGTGTSTRTGTPA